MAAMWFKVTFPDLPGEREGRGAEVTVLAEDRDDATEKARRTAETARPGSRAAGLLERAEPGPGRPPS